jgi:hypothetical protein
MQTLGNLCIGLAALIYVVPWQMLQASNARGGHASVGLLLSSLALGLPLGLLLAAAFGAAVARGGFDWLPLARSGQYVLVLTAGLLVALLCVAVSALRLEPASQQPWMLRAFTPWLALWLPPLLVIAAAVMLNAAGDGIPLRSARTLWLLASTVALVVAAGLLGEWVYWQGQRQQAVQQETLAFQNRRDQQMLAEVQQMDPLRDVSGLLNFSNVYETDPIRQLALAKLAQHPDLDAAIVHELTAGRAYEAIIYLQGNDPPHPERVAAAVAVGIERIAADLARSIAGTHTLYPEQGETEVMRILDVVARLRSHGVDYTPALLRLRGALQHEREGQVQLQAVRRLRHL